MEADMEPELSADATTVKHWLQHQVNKTISIRKNESGDSDFIDLEIHMVGYRPDAVSADDYTDGPALVIHGSGTLRANRQRVPLPDGQYVIPLEGLSVIRSNDNALLFKTERAEYDLCAIPSPVKS